VNAEVNAELIARARAADSRAFSELVEPYRRELRLHCYRILGSVQDAEDAVQETLVAAWKGLGGFAERASIRTWLYQIATNRCLNALRAASRRPRPSEPAVVGLELPEPTRLGEVEWLQPYPDHLLEGLADTAPGPQARYETREAISLAFITAVQLLPPRQRAVLILRDVLGFSAHEVADMLEATEGSVTSALARARAALAAQRRADVERPPPAPNSAAERKLVAAFTHAFAAGDVDALIALLTHDVVLSMPPLPLLYQGREVATRFHSAITFRDGRTYRTVPTRANGQPAFGLYIQGPHAEVLHANGLMVLTLAGGHISAMTRFDNTVLGHFGLPRTLPT
jgi:RNA polymerase sigma-70 factor (TIGR02960 family)